MHKYQDKVYIKEQKGVILGGNMLFYLKDQKCSCLINGPLTIENQKVSM